MDTKQKTAVTAGGVAAGSLLLWWLLRKKAFGFTLKIINPPQGTVYWATEGGMFQLDQAWYYSGEVFEPQYLQINFLDTNYECPTGDPGCDGANCWFAPENGKHYLLDCADCTITEGDEPENGHPTPDEPDLLSLSPIVTKPAAEYWPDTKWYLPKPWQTGQFSVNPHYWLWLYIENIQNIVFSLEVPQAIAPLNNPDGEYTYHGTQENYDTPEGTQSRFGPSKAIWGVGAMSPGEYPISGKIGAMQLLDGDQLGPPQVWYDLGIVGKLVVEESYWFQLQNLVCPASAPAGSTVQVSIDVRNTGIEAGTCDVICVSRRSDGGQLVQQQTVTVAPGVSLTVTFLVPTAGGYVITPVGISIPGFGGTGCDIVMT